MYRKKYKYCGPSLNYRIESNPLGQVCFEAKPKKKKKKKALEIIKIDMKVTHL